jgi:lipid II:glycine glycyltransferase (peptidoglycan interpeptide bridge formation enzyme)
MPNFLLEKSSNLEAYKQFIRRSISGHFMQTTDWSDFKSRFGWDNSAGQYIVKKDDVLVAAFSILIKSKMGIRILYVPRGPVWDISDSELTKFVLDSLKSIAKKNKAFFLRISPAILESNNAAKELIKQQGFNLSKKQLQTKATVLIDLKQNTEELLNSFHKKTRYNIKLAEKKGVVIGKASSITDIDNLYEILIKMAERQNYTLQSKEYYVYIWEKLCKSHIADIYIAKNSENRVIGGIVVFYFSGKTYYMYGGFDYEYRQLMGNYLIHWTIINDAKARGDEYYDLQGIPLNITEQSPMYGFYKFKIGFNGAEVEYIGEYDWAPFPQAVLYWFWNNLRFEKELYLK